MIPHILVSRAVAIGFAVIFFSCGTFTASAQDFRTVHDGVEYTELNREIGGVNVRMNLLKLDLSKVRIDVRHALDKAVGVETTSSIALRHGAVAAINAGFFRLDKSSFGGDDVGFLLIDKQLWSEPAMNRTALAISNGKRSTEVIFGRWNFAGYLRWRSHARPNLLKGLNREAKKGEIIAFTTAFGDVVPRAAGEVRITVRKKRVVAVCAEDCKIPPNGFVLAGSGDGASFLKELTPGESIDLSWDLRDGVPGASRFMIEDAVAGVPRLISDGKMNVAWQEERSSRSFVETRHPRTAVARLKDGKFLLITVDGRSESSGGLGLYDLAKFLLELGAVDALNLDGGGSTTMFLDGKVVNKPSDKEGERKVGDAILVTLRKR